MPLYQLSKFGILGLVRGMRDLDLSFPISCTSTDRSVIRVNVLCPGMTESAVTAHLTPKFRASQEASSEKRAFWQTSEDVAKIIAHVMVSGDIHGKSFYIENATS
jgi:NAD(P)-dependent dehydrogenase (short-subunit alcohol dehydrogenase family)